MSVIITLEGYNLEEAKIAIVKQLIQDTPDVTVEGAALLLGISVRTLFRFLYVNKDIKFSKKKFKELTEESAIIFLQTKGYKVKK